MRRAKETVEQARAKDFEELLGKVDVAFLGDRNLVPHAMDCRYPPNLRPGGPRVVRLADECIVALRGRVERLEGALFDQLDASCPEMPTAALASHMGCSECVIRDLQAERDAGDGERSFKGRLATLEKRFEDELGKRRKGR